MGFAAWWPGEPASRPPGGSTDKSTASVASRGIWRVGGGASVAGWRAKRAGLPLSATTRPGQDCDEAVAGAAKRPRPPPDQRGRSGPKAHHLGIHLIPSAAPILWRGAWAPPFQPAPPPILCVGVRIIFVPGSAPRRAAKQPLGPKGALPGCPNVGVRRVRPGPLSGEARHSASVYGSQRSALMWVGAPE